MAREFNQRFYNSTAWKKCRASYILHRIAADGGMCESCGNSLGYILHHKIRLTPENINDPEITLAFDNLQYVCKNCHELIHFCEENEINYQFDESGQPKPNRPY